MASNFSSSRHRGVSVFSMRLTSTVSVTLVLLLLGIAALLGASARNISDTLRSRVGFVVILSDTATVSDANRLKQFWTHAPYTGSVKYRSAEDVLRQWQAMNPDEEDLKGLLGVNPFFPEFEINVRPAYAHPDSLSAITEAVRKMPAVRHVRLQSQMVSSLNSTFRIATAILAAGSAIMLLIAFVLINNTVRLTIYARRFTIRTMQLVGATDGFIRRPILISNALQGLTAAIAAIVLIGAGVYYCATVYPEVEEALSVRDLSLTALLLAATGVIVCAGAALFAANRYLRADYDEMYS